MKVIFTKPFVKLYQNLPQQIQEKFDKQLVLLLENPRHPSLRVKKTKGQSEDIFEARISRGYRFTLKLKEIVIF